MHLNVIKFNVKRDSFDFIFKTSSLRKYGYFFVISNVFFLLQTTCQDTDLNAVADNGDEDVEAEQDELLLECAGDVIPKFGNAIPPDDFFLYFPNILQLLMIRTVLVL